MTSTDRTSRVKPFTGRICSTVLDKHGDFCFCKHGLKDTVSLCMLCNVVWHQGFIMNLKCQSLSCGILSLFSVVTKEQFTTVPLKSKLTLETWPSRLNPRALMLETFKDRVSSLEDRETRLSWICKNSKGFRGNNLFLERKIIQYCSHLQSSTSVSRRSLSRENFRPKDSGLTVTFQAETTCVQN